MTYVSPQRTPLFSDSGYKMLNYDVAFARMADSREISKRQGCAIRDVIGLQEKVIIQEN